MKYTNSKRLILQQFQIDDAYVKQLFDNCNWLYFNNELPDIPVKLIQSTTINGDFNFDVDFKENKITNMYININSATKRTKNKFLATMLHEMLHYKVALEIPESEITKAIWYYNDDQIDKFNEILYVGKYAHTGKWLEYANAINNKYKLNISLK